MTWWFAWSDTTWFKVDLLISRESAFEKSRFQRKLLLPAGKHQFWVSSAEDIVLAKLEWYRLGNEMQDHQWRRLDQDHLERWAAELKVLNLLEKARHVLRSAGDG